jgi:hypothetical protein
MFNFIMAILQILGAIAIIGFWVYFYKVENKNPENTEVYLNHERSFPVADLGWLVPTLIIGAIGNLLGENFGIFFTIISGSGLIFLGLLDITFHTQQGGFTSDKGEAIMDLTVFIGGIISIIYAGINFISLIG